MTNNVPPKSGAKDVLLALVFEAQLTGMVTVIPVIRPEVTDVTLSVNVGLRSGANPQSPSLLNKRHGNEGNCTLQKTSSLSVTHLYSVMNALAGSNVSL